MTRFIAPLGSGDGSSWSRAANIADLSRQIGLAGPGGTVSVRADPGDQYLVTKAVSITAGGRADAPVLIAGRRTDGRVRKFIVRGTRQAWTLPSDVEEVTDVSGWNHGNDLFYFQAGASHLTFANFELRDCQAGIVFRSPVRNITLRDFSGYNVRNFQDITSGISAEDVVIQRGTVVGFSKKAFRMRGSSSDWRFEDLSADSCRQDRDDFAAGLVFDEAAHDAIVRRCEFANCHDTLNEYRNGDGVSSELQNYNIVLEDVVSHGHTDGGFDHKGMVTCRRTYCYDNKVNYRSWNNLQKAENIRSGPTRHRGGSGMRAHVGLYGTDGKSANFVIAGMEVFETGIPDSQSDLAIFWRWTAGSRLRVRGLDLANKPSQTPIWKDSAFGPAPIIGYGESPALKVRRG